MLEKIVLFHLGLELCSSIKRPYSRLCVAGFLRHMAQQVERSGVGLTACALAQNAERLGGLSQPHQNKRAVVIDLGQVWGEAARFVHNFQS